MPQQTEAEQLQMRQRILNETNHRAWNLPDCSCSPPSSAEAQIVKLLVQWTATNTDLFHDFTGTPVEQQSVTTVGCRGNHTLDDLDRNLVGHAVTSLETKLAPPRAWRRSPDTTGDPNRNTGHPHVRGEKGRVAARKSYHKCQFDIKMPFQVFWFTPPAAITTVRRTYPLEQSGALACFILSGIPKRVGDHAMIRVVYR